MADFGWAFVKGNLLTSSAGPSGSVQYNNNASGLTGSSDLIFISGSTSELRLTGALNIEGDLSSSSNISASAFYGDGSNLTGITTSPAGATTQIQFNDAGAFAGSANLTFGNSTLKVTGTLEVTSHITSSANISASAFYGDGSNLTGINSVNIDNDGVNRLLVADGDGTMTAQTNATFDGSEFNITGTLNVSGTINANEINIDVENRTVINITKTGSTNFGDTSDDRHRFTGSVDVSTSITASQAKLTGLTAGTGANNSSYLALDSNNNVVLTSSSGGSGGTIGDAEDGDYTDGLFVDFTTSTPIGTPIDRFNEVLKILAPSPAPSLSRINYDNTTGSIVKLSFGSSEPLSDYDSSSTAAGFDAVNVAETYQAETSGSNFRLGAYDGTENVTGFLNFNVSESETNGNLSYSNDAFANAETGSLKLELNGATVHTIDLSATVGAGNPNSGSASSLNSSGSGFTSISVTASSFDGNASEWYIFKHRTAKFVVDTDSMRPGWNYVRAVHTIGSTDYATNYLEWINDPSGSVNDLSVSNARIEDIALIGSKYLSGVQYNTDATASYKVNINNLYRNVYQNSGTPISFTVSNSTTPSPQSVEDIDFAGGENNTKVLGVTASLDYNGNSLLSGSITSNITVAHPFKNTITNVGSATTGNGFLIDNRTLASTNLSEKFHDETYRITSGAYSNSGDPSDPTSIWDSENHMTSSGATGHTDGLIFYNQRLYSPKSSDVAGGGDFSSLANTETGQPDYSSITGTRTFFRKIQNTSLENVYNMRIDTTKASTTFNDNPTLGSSNAHFFIKVPGSTGWMDVSQNFSYGNNADGEGALIPGAANDTDSGNNTHFITFGTESAAPNEYIILKIEADADWSGYISQLDFTIPANDSQATPQVLSDIDVNDAGSTAILSFGNANSIADYSNATGSLISLDDYDSNDAYTYGGSEGNRRGVFSSFTTIDGTLNDAISAGSGYPSDAFFNGYSGSLVLEVNGAEVHEVSLASSLSAISNDVNGNSSGFDLSAVDFSTLSNIPSYIEPYRTGTYQIGTGDQNKGWNYARVIHRTSSDQVTNYVEWVVDPSGSTDDTAVSTPVLSNFNHDDIYYQSGIAYFASNPSASFAFTGSNFYRNVYQSGSAISFPTTTNCSVENIRVIGSGITTFDGAVSSTVMPALNNDPNCETTSIEITGTLQYDGGSPAISGGLGGLTTYTVVATGRVLHPFKSDRTTTAASKTGFMIYSGSIGSTDLNNHEHFNTEDYRIVSGNYANQAAVTSSSNSWNPQTSINDTASYAEHADGLVTVNGIALSPFNIGNAGDTRNVDDGGSLQAPSGNPDYSSLSEDIRTVYRYFRNETGLSSLTPTITLYGDANLIAKSGGFYTGSLGANKNITVEFKVPFDPNFTGGDDTSTAWSDCIKPFSTGVQPTTDGVGIFNGGGSDLNQTVGLAGRAVQLQLQQSQIRDDQYFVVKISAHKDWTGYLSRISITY